MTRQGRAGCDCMAADVVVEADDDNWAPERGAFRL
jgi:hypothetical protein